MIIVVIGKPCTGKTFFREYIKKKDDIISYEASDYIKMAKYKYNISETRLLLNKIGSNYVTKNIYNIITKKKKLESNNIVISGLRTLEEVDFLVKKFGEVKVKIILIQANVFLCYLRNIKRNRCDKEMCFFKFINRGRRDVKLGMSKIIKKYNVIKITNNTTKNNFKQNIEKCINNIKLDFDLKERG